MKNIIVQNNPLIGHYVNSIRDMGISAFAFREYIAYISQNLLHEASNELPFIDKKITTWQGEESFRFIDQENIVFVPILRAGMPMLDGLNKVLPDVTSGFVAMKRDEETLEPKIYYDRLHELKGKTVVLLDPMVATGGSLKDAITLIKEREPEKIISLNILASPDGIEEVAKTHGDVKIYIAKIDEKLNNKGFILPGIGDAGDRAYNTL